ncbi:MAG: ABC transporter permease [Leptospiraceae bacterium]|nr:ABC transporter permease [Leptospiraceae bacterium]MDW8307318.1 ABC transporter permease [Leptospiraceae bacterium]
MSLYESLLFLLRRLYLLFYLIKKHFVRNFFSSLGLFLTLSIVIFLLALLRPIKQALVQRAERSLPQEIVRVSGLNLSEKTPSLPFFAAEKDIAFGITEAKLKKISSWPGVRKVYRSQVLQRPAMATLDHPLVEKLGFKFYFDVLFQGIEAELVKDYLGCMQDFRIQKEKQNNGHQLTVIPIVVPESFAEIAYTYAAVHGFAQFQMKDLLGLRLKIRLGESTLGIRSSHKETAIGIICGFVPPGLVTAAGIPLDFVKSQHILTNQKKARESYDQLFIVLQNERYFPEIKKRLLTEKLSISEKKNRYTEIFRFLGTLDYVFWGFAFVLLGLSMLAMANSFSLLALEKKYEFGLYLVFGASPFFLWFLIFFEGAFWGFLHANVSLLVAEKIFRIVEETLSQSPWLLSLGLTGNAALQFDLSPIEKGILILAATLIAGISSLVPTFFLLGKKTLNLVKKD